MAENERGPFISTESFPRGRDLIAQFRAEKPTILLRICAGGTGHLGLLRIAAVMTVDAAARSKKIERAVDRDPVQPRAEVRTLLESIQLAVRAQERLLNHVVGIVFISRNPISDPKNWTTMLLNEQPEGVGITGPRPAHGRCVGCLHPIGLRLKICKGVSS